ncbi:zf-RVT domain-containing protein, partial [Cephalotus follicularis]
LNLFFEASGLAISKMKSSIFFCNTNSGTRRVIIRTTQFQEDTLPIKYLGLPLITKRLSKHDCAPFIERILARANSRVSKSLSYAGRLQLIKFTLASMQVFWCSSFMLPASVIKECERILRRFLWGGSSNAVKQSLVKWAKVCTPCQEGGLGVKNLTTWNTTLLLKQVWNLLIDHSLWMQWCKMYLIRKHSFWILPIRGLHSWAWRQILNLRSTALMHLLYVICRGNEFSLWYDPWFHVASIHALYGHGVIHDAGMVGNEKGQDAIVSNQWCWPETTWELREIKQSVRDIPITNSPDKIFWGSIGQVFSTHKAWQAIRPQYAKVNWFHLVWHPNRIPKQAFCLCLSILGAHRTRNKLMPLGIVDTDECVFNCGDKENVAHLFFACPYSSYIWSRVLNLCSIYKYPLPWLEEIQWMVEHSKGKQLLHRLRKVAFGAAIYHI